MSAGRHNQAGQALVLVVALAAATLVAACAIVAVSGAVAGKARLQRAADLAAVSAARSIRDDLPRLLAPRFLPGGAPNPGHLLRSDLFRRAEAAALDAARRNGAASDRVRVSFPDRGSPVPLRARVAIHADLGRAGGGGEATTAPAAGARVSAWAIAEASPPGTAIAGTEPVAEATGGGYGGVLVHRDGEGMRPDVAAAFDRMAVAALAAGHRLTVTSAFRSDAEQAALFAAHPDPRWVAPPGRSLHRCATELDLGPPSAYGWLAAHAPRFGFELRYGWEPWHWGYSAGPAPCSAAGEAAHRAVLGRADGDGGDGRLAAAGLPSFVPAAYRAPISRAAARSGVPAALLAAQLQAESGFNPRAVSPAGAQGIAQFMPATAAAYGLDDPFDPAAAIAAQARLMADLLRRFGSNELALAAYNAGPGAVEACGCVPPYPETRAYVARVLGALGAAGVAAAPALEVRLVG